MSYFNNFLPVQNLLKTTINPGGMCWVLFFRHRDVAIWPQMDPTTGLIATDLVFKPGASFFTLQTSEKGRVFTEKMKHSNAGDYLANEVAGTISGNNLNHITSVTSMQAERMFGVLLKERNGEKRLIGNQDAGALFEYDYTSGDIYSSRLRSVKFTFDSAFPVPVYNSGGIVLDTTIINIGGGTSGTISNGNFDLHARFKVQTGGAMQPGDGVYTNNDLVNKRVLVFVDGTYIPQVVDVIKRHCTKVAGSNSINFFGGVSDGELIEIFTY
jgi:hypothetical protein